MGQWTMPSILIRNSHFSYHHHSPFHFSAVNSNLVDFISPFLRCRCNQILLISVLRGKKHFFFIEFLFCFSFQVNIDVHFYGIGSQRKLILHIYWNCAWVFFHRFTHFFRLIKTHMWQATVGTTTRRQWRDASRKYTEILIYFSITETHTKWQFIVFTAAYRLFCCLRRGQIKWNDYLSLLNRFKSIPRADILTHIKQHPIGVCIFQWPRLKLWLDFHWTEFQFQCFNLRSK